MTVEAWLIFVVAESALRRAVMVVVSTGLARGGRASLWTNFGVLSANGVYFALSALGVGALSALEDIAAASRAPFRSGLTMAALRRAD